MTSALTANWGHGRWPVELRASAMRPTVHRAPVCSMSSAVRFERDTYVIFVNSFVRGHFCHYAFEQCYFSQKLENLV